MEQIERATVMLRKSSNREDRLRQAMIDGLVRREVQQDIEATLQEVGEARNRAAQMEAQAKAVTRQLDQAKAQINDMSWHITDLKRQAQERAEHYRQLEYDYQKRQRIVQGLKEGLQIAAMAVTAIAVLVGIDVLGRIVYGLLMH